MPKLCAITATDSRTHPRRSRSWKGYYAKQEWRDEFIRLIQAFSPIADHLEFADLVRSLEASGRFVRLGERTATPVPYEHSVDDYLAMLASTSSLSRVTLGTRADD